MCNKRKGSLQLIIDEIVGEVYIDDNVLGRELIFSSANRCLVVPSVTSLKHLYAKSVTGGSHFSHAA
jgi:hypothetical protein